MKKTLIYLSILFIILIIIQLLTTDFNSNKPNYERADEVNINNHLLINEVVSYYRKENNIYKSLKNSYIIIMIPNYTNYPDKFSYIKYDDSLKLNSVLKAIKNDGKLSEKNLKEIRKWLSMKKVYSQNKLKEDIENENIKIKSELVAYNKHLSKNELSNSIRRIRDKDKELQELQDKLEDLKNSTKDLIKEANNPRELIKPKK
tara:strand:- start:311 stop:919 length:609 start_codon:yes stop_codon:yes gene_type:complete